MPPVPRILIVGAGITGTAINHFLQKAFPTYSCTIWERQSMSGGRMQTDNNDGMSYVDMGAQYLNKFSNDEELYNELSSAGVLRPMTAAIGGMREKNSLEPERVLKTHFVSATGLSAITDYFSRNTEVMYDLSLESLSYEPFTPSTSTDSSSDPRSRRIKAVGWRNNMPLGRRAGPNVNFKSDTASSSSATTSTSITKVEELFDCVVLTMPTPHVLAVTGDVTAAMFHQQYPTSTEIESLPTTATSPPPPPTTTTTTAPLIKLLQAVKYSSRYALALYYPPSAWSR